MAEKWSLGRALRGMFVKPTIDETTWDDLETALITADFGPDITERIVDELRDKVDKYHTTDPRDLQRMLKETLEEHFAKFDTTLKLTERPAVVLVVREPVEPLREVPDVLPEMTGWVVPAAARVPAVEVW